MNESTIQNSTARERFLDAILQSAVDYAILSLDLDGRITSWNEGANRILGWPCEEALGQPVSMIFTEEDRLAGVPQREMAAALDKGVGDDERWHLRKDKSQFFASGRMMALKSDDGSVEGFLKILRDRTDHREIEERQRVLMHELNHRMKNTLTVVQAIATQSFRNATSLKEAASSISSRLFAYSKAHDILLQRDWAGTTLAAIVEATATSLGLEASNRFHMHGPTVEVGPQAALSFALVLHELGTNARKYGSLSGESGVVDVKWAVTNESGTDRLHFCWAESGGPDVAEPARKGFGSRLISSSLGAFGKVSTHYRREGVLVEVDADLKLLGHKAYS